MKLTFTNHTLSIGEVEIAKAFALPSLGKLKPCMDFYRANNRFDRQIIKKAKDVDVFRPSSLL